MSSGRLVHRLKSVVGATECRLYDWRHRIRTCGDVAVSALGISGSSAAHAVEYAPSHPRFLYHLMKHLGIDYASYNFVDLGSGKGRALFVASDFPFRKIV